MGTKYIQDYITFAEEQIDTENDLTSIERADLENILDNAVARYSRDIPREVVTQVTGDGSYRYSLPSDWTSGFSYILGIEYPAGEQVPAFLRRSSYRIHDTGDGNGKKIQFLDRTPTTSDTFAVHYVAEHSVTSTTSTIDDSDFEAVGYLFCHHVCIALAGRLRRSTDSRLQADMIDLRRTKADEYLTQAKAFYKAYKDQIGLPEKGPKAADLVADVDLHTPWGSNTGYLTHHWSR